MSRPPASLRESARQALELAAFRRMLTASRGAFSLSFAVCNSPTLRDYLIEDVRRSKPHIEVVRVSPNAADVFALASDRTGARRLPALFLVDLEQSLGAADADQPLLRSLNASRERWERTYRCPVVFWISEAAADLIERHARDFWRYRSHVFAFVSRHASASAGVSDPYSGNLGAAAALPVDEKRFRIAELEERVADAGPEPRPDLTYHVRSWFNELEYLYESVGEPERAARLQVQAPSDIQTAGRSTTTFRAAVSGSGAIAQGERPVAAGAGGVAVGRDVQDSVILAGRIEGDVYVGPPTQDAGEALEIYRRVIAAASRYLPLRGIDIGASDPTSGQTRLSLARVYVDLETKTRVPRREGDKPARRRELAEADARTLSALEAISGKPRAIVVLGEPGSGKSTLFSHVAFCLAMHGLEPQQGWLRHLPEWPEALGRLVPIPVVMRDFGARLAGRAKDPEPGLLWEFIEQRMKGQNLAFACDPLLRCLDRGEAIVLVDGLDEISAHAAGGLARRALAAFIDRYPESRHVVSCRTLAYQDRAWQIEGLPAFELSPFDEERIDRFIAAWYDELAHLGVLTRDAARTLADGLRRAVRQPDLRRLAPNPLLLTVMALVNTHKGRLPDARAQLYDDAVDLLLWRWDELKATAAVQPARLRELLRQANLAETDFKGTLWRVAFDMHGRSKSAGEDAETTADIAEAHLRDALAAIHPDGSLDWAVEVIETMKVRAGLLLERAPGVFAFPHRTFQEYLAAAHLAAQPDFGELAASLLADNHALWREAVLLAVGRLVYVVGDIAKPIALADALCPPRWRASALAWRKTWLAGEVLVETGPDRAARSESGSHILERARPRLAKLVGQGRLTPVERAAAGDALGRLGDPRFRPDAWHLPKEPLLGFVEIPEGPFRMGSDKKKDSEAFDDELREHEVRLPAYYIGKYPVTVAQFRAFVEDAEFKVGDSDALRGIPNHPVVSVSWEEALAYCRWLTEKLRAWDKTPDPLRRVLREGDEGRPWVVTLPSEAQWEKAARGAKEARRYPWGDAFDPHAGNSVETGVGRTMAVGSFPRGRSPFGVDDLSGNVWEWTRSLWGRDFEKPDFGYPYDPKDVRREDLTAPSEVARVLRGGSFPSFRRLVRSACRFRNLPVDRFDSIGFRVVVSPFS